MEESYTISTIRSDVIYEEEHIQDLPLSTIKELENVAMSIKGKKAPGQDSHWSTKSIVYIWSGAVTKRI